ncbi:sunset domain-containing protein [Mesorhizobium sp. 128a]
MGLQGQKPIRRRRRSLLEQRALIPVLLCGVAGASYLIPQTEQHPLPTVHRQGSASTAPDGCNIKGNVSMETGERIYHMPGQRYYNQTVVNPAKGERWFCSEWQAWMAGWRKSKV